MKKFAIALMITALTAMAAQAQGVVGSIVDGKVAITLDADTALSGLNLKSAGGNFVPIPPGDTTAPAAPFTFLLANNASNVSYAAIPGTTVAVSAGTLVTGVGYTGDAAGVTDDMAASAYGNAAFQQVTFPTNAPVVPEPATGILAAIAGLGLLGFRRRR